MAARGQGRTWGAAIVCGLVLAAVLIMLPRPLLFAPQGRDACSDRGIDYNGLYESGSGTRSDPVPDGARCIDAGASDPIVDVPISFFGPDNLFGDLLAWLYRLACVTLPLATALWLGARWSGTRLL